MQSSKKKLTKYLLLSILTIILVGIDQISKYLIVNRLNIEKNYPVIPQLISFEYLENRGVAFGFMDGKMTLITIVVILVTIGIIYIIKLLQNSIYRNYDLSKKFSFLQILCTFMIAGAIGNLIDRIRLGYVVDFIKFDFIDFPSFNIADCYVVVATILVFIILMFFTNENEFESLFHKEV